MSIDFPLKVIGLHYLYTYIFKFKRKIMNEKLLDFPLSECEIFAIKK